ncbi:unnamed protein product [Polarella glacialis]|uniref:Uncharacterized protein n=1 Tax=Polarella glacialis TaxID=89957 RepID=A0A813G7N0_POLGL|nr:unnamed protein product [Polarella glacialis]
MALQRHLLHLCLAVLLESSAQPVRLGDLARFLQNTAGGEFWRDPGAQNTGERRDVATGLSVIDLSHCASGPGVVSSVASLTQQQQQEQQP